MVNVAKFFMVQVLKGKKSDKSLLKHSCLSLPLLR